MTRLLLEGEAVQVWESEDAADPGPGPAGFVWRGTSHQIEERCNRWRIHTRWWEVGEEIWREYWKVTTDQGVLCQLYHDLLDGRWFLSRVYD
jgi:hypothetical protein